MQRTRYRTTGYYSNFFPPGVKWLLISNTALFVLYFFGVRLGYARLFRDFSLWPRAVIEIPAVWQLVTYMFLHDPFGFFHILFNMLTLWMFGIDLERDWGTRRFVRYYFLCGIGAGVCVVVANLFFGSLDTRTIGASGAIYGLLLAFGLCYPDRMVLLSFLFPIKAKYFVMILGTIAFLSSLGASGSGVSHVAHLGGMVIGYFYLKRRSLRLDPIEALSQRYQTWKFMQKRKKFQLYMRDEESKRNRHIH